MKKMYAIGLALGCVVLACAVQAEKKHSIVYEEESAFELSTYSTDQIEPILPLMDKWVRREFFQYPYLWLPLPEEYSRTNVLLIHEKQALVTVVKKGQQVVGIAAGVPFDSDVLRMTLEAEGTRVHQLLMEKMKKNGFDPSNILYMNFFLTAPEYRNDEDLVDLIYNNYVDFAHQIGKTQLCYFEDPGQLDHPLRPEYPTPIEPWGHIIHGFRSMHMKCDLSWPTVQQDGTAKDQAHSVEFFIKDI